MWIKTEGGYLLNTDQIEFISYDEERDCTFARVKDIVHIISKDNTIDNLFNVLTRGGGQYHARK
jgi:hypothetical protein